MQWDLNSFRNYARFPEFYSHIPHFKIPVFRMFKNINSLNSEQIITVISAATLSVVLTYTRWYHHYIKTYPVEKGSLPGLDLTSPQLFKICLYYVCNPYLHNIKVSAIFSSQLGRIKTHICNCICIPGCSSAFAFLLLRLYSWTSPNILLGKNTIYLALHMIFMGRKS